MVVYGRSSVRGCVVVLLLLFAGIGGTAADLASTVLAAIDNTTDPCDDFYQYACGGWVANHTLREDQDRLLSFVVVDLRVKKRIKSLLEGLSNETSGPKMKASKVYQACMNEAKINELGTSLVSDLNMTTFENDSDIVGILTKLESAGLHFLLEVTVKEDRRNSSRYIIHIDQLRYDRSVTARQLKERNSTITQSYEDYLYDLMGSLFPSSSLSRSEITTIVDFEIQLINSSLTRSQQKGMDFYTQMTVSELENNISGLGWQNFLQGLLDGAEANVTIGGQTEVIVADENYLKSMLRLIKDERYNESVINFLRVRTAETFASFLTEEIRNLSQSLYQVKKGTAKEAPRWETCVERTRSDMDHVIGKVYADNYFNESSKTDLVDKITYVGTALKNMITNASWMDEESRNKSIEKVDRMIVKLGYPDYYSDAFLEDYYTDVNYSTDQYFQNYVKFLRWDAKRTLQLLKRPTNKTEWDTAHRVRARYNLAQNSIQFSAGLLSDPFYNTDFPRSMLFGAIGMFIGHEMSHGFDNQGRMYDVDGNARQWWTNETIANYKNRTECFVDQYDDVVIIGDIKMNGRRSLGENLADNSGLKAAYEAYKLWVANNAEEDAVSGLPFSHQQLFYIANSQIWCNIMTAEYLRTYVANRKHPYESARGRVPASNMKAFSEAFNCSRTSNMNLPARDKNCILF